MRKLTLPVLVCSAALLTACSHTPVAVCPTPVEYTTGQQLDAIEQIQKLPPESILVRFLLDYSELRERLRACQ